MIQCVSESDGYGSRNLTASRENASASRAQTAGVGEVTGIVIAGNLLYAGTVTCFSALSDDDPPHPASRRVHKRPAPANLLIRESVDAERRAPPMAVELAPEGVRVNCFTAGYIWNAVTAGTQSTQGPPDESLEEYARAGRKR